MWYDRVIFLGAGNQSELFDAETDGNFRFTDF